MLLVTEFLYLFIHLTVLFLLFQAVAFENSDMMLQKEHAEHINFCQVDVNNQHASKFKRRFNLTVKLAFLTQKSWVTDLKGGYEIIERGFKHGYGKYYVYVFRIGKVIVYDTYGFPRWEICIYYSWKPA